MEGSGLTFVIAGIILIVVSVIFAVTVHCVLGRKKREIKEEVTSWKE